MGYIVVEDFKIGLDARRDAIVGLPGSLIEGENGHITSGGDFERAKKFVPKYELDPGKTFGMHTASSLIYVFGSDASPTIPSGVTYQRLQHPDGLAMIDVIESESFDGKPYVIAEYDGGDVMHFYDGALVDDWVSGVVRVGMTDNDGIATHLASIVDGKYGVSAVAAGNVVTITGPVGDEFTIAGEVENGGATNDQTITVATPTPGIAGIDGVSASGGFTIIGGTASAGVNKVSSVKVDGIEVLGAAVDWTISHSATAENVAAQINTNVSSPDYTATANDDISGRITITSVATGAEVNFKFVTVTLGGDVTVSNVLNMSGGVTAATGQAQVSTVTVGGTFEVGDKFTVTINGRPFGVVDNPHAPGRTALTLKSKLYSTAGSLVYFGAVNDPTLFNRSDAAADVSPGAGFINMANQDEGSEELSALGNYQGNLAVFSRNAIQIQYVDVDPAFNSLLQPLKNTGTMAKGSVVSYGNNDTFYLDDNGIRSLKARDASNVAYASDVGSPIDPLVITQMSSLTAANLAKATGIIADSGRYWLAIGDKVFVFSYFPGAKISAWTIYSPGFQITDMIQISRRIYARSGDTIYLYGGDDNDIYPDAGENVVRARLPFLTAGKPAHKKGWKALDAAIQGTWTVSVLLDPNDEDLTTAPITMDEHTHPDGQIPIEAESTHCAPLFVCSAAGYAKISSIIVHHDLEDDS